MDNFDIDNIDSLSEQQVRYLLKTEMARNKLLVKQNHFCLFRYEVKDDLMVILIQKADGTIEHKAYKNYLNQSPGEYFDESEHKKVCSFIKSVIDDAECPKTGSVDFNFMSGEGVTTEYTSLLDDDCNVITITGQHVNMYETHERMVSTIKMLNEQVSMADAISKSYETMILVNMRDLSFQLLKATPDVTAASKMCNSVLDLAKLFSQYFITPEYQNGFKDFTDTLTIDNRLERNRVVVYEYKTNNIGFCRARIVPGEIDSRGRLKTALFTTERSFNNVEEMQVLRIAATTDALTGLNNRYNGELLLNNKLNELSECIYIIFDCDHFKEINDRLGHPVGDQVLIEVSKALSEEFEGEILMRLGGDEFVVLISCHELVEKVKNEGIEAIFSSLRRRLNKISIKSMRGYRPRISAGAVFISANATHDLSVIYDMADKLLYEAKVSHKGKYAYKTI